MYSEYTLCIFGYGFASGIAFLLVLISIFHNDDYKNKEEKEWQDQD